MALATRCPHCHTTFRVVQDQLKLYSGIVRCGVCHQIFNGADYLLDDEPSATPSVKPRDEKTAPSERVASVEQPQQPEPRPKESPPQTTAGNEPKQPPQPRQEDSATYDPFGSTELRLGEHPEDEGYVPPIFDEDIPIISLDLEDERQDTQQDEGSHEFLELDVPSSDGFDTPKASRLSQNEPRIEPVWSNTLSLFDDIGQPEEPKKPKVIKPAQGTKQATTGDQQRSAISSRDIKQPEAAKQPDVEPAPPKEIKPEQEPEQPQPTQLPAFNQAALDAYLGEPEPAEIALDIPEPPAVPVPTPKPSPTSEPAFIKKAKSKQRSRRTSRILYAIGSFILLMLLALQSVYAFRDRIVSAIPSSEPIIAGVCAVLNCESRIESRIDELAIDSSELQSLPDRPNTFTLDIVLRNSASAPQVWPNIELTLNDESGQPAVRRVFQPNEYLAETPHAGRIEKGFPPLSEQTIKLAFTLDRIKAADYRVYLFYP